MNPKDLPEIPALLRVERTVAQLSHEIAEELGMIRCTGPCGRFYAREQIEPDDGRCVVCAWEICENCGYEFHPEDMEPGTIKRMHPKCPPCAKRIREQNT